MCTLSCALADEKNGFFFFLLFVQERSVYPEWKHKCMLNSDKWCVGWCSTCINACLNSIFKYLHSSFPSFISVRSEPWNCCHQSAMFIFPIMFHASGNERNSYCRSLQGPNLTVTLQNSIFRCCSSLFSHIRSLDNNLGNKQSTNSRQKLMITLA